MHLFYFLMPKIADILRIVGRLVPETLAEDWDNVGLQAGSVEWPARGILLALDADLSVLEKAKEVDANVIITHHPLIFTPLKRLNLDTPVGRVLERAVVDRIVIYSAHTNLDIVEGGVNDTLADRIGLLNKRPLASIGRVGELAAPETIGRIAEKIKADFSIPHVTTVGSRDKLIKTVAVCGGSGGSLVQDAAESGADLLITGDVKYHAAKDSEACGLSVIDMGHFASESSVLPVLASLIKKTLEGEGIDIGVHVHWGNDPLRIC